MRFLGGILVLVLALGAAWLTGEYIEDLKQQLVNEKVSYAEEQVTSKKLLSEAAAAKDLAIINSNNLAKQLEQEKLELQKITSSANHDREQAVKRTNEIQAKFSDVPNSESVAVAAQTQIMPDLTALTHEKDDLSSRLSKLQQKFEILDQRLTLKNEEVSKLRSEISDANSVVLDLARINELKKDLIRLPTSIDIAVPDAAKTATHLEMKPRFPAKQAVRTLPVVRPPLPLVLIPTLRKAPSRVVERRPVVVARQSGDDSVYPSSFGLPSGLPSGLKPIGY